MPGWGRRAAQDVIAETGVDMSRFRTAGHLASWAGRTPLDKQSGGRTGRAAKRQPVRGRRRSARPPSPPGRPRPAKAPATGGSPAAAARPKPASPSATPS